MLSWKSDLIEHYHRQDTGQKELRRTEGEFREAQDRLSKVKDEEAVINMDKARLDTQMQVLAEEVMGFWDLGMAEFGTVKTCSGIGRCGAKNRPLKKSVGLHWRYG